MVVEEATDAVRAPLGALFRHGEGWAIYRVVEGRAILTPLETGIADENHRVVTRGVAAGDTVVLFPGNAIVDGQSVQQRESE